MGVDHQGLAVQMLDETTMRIALTVVPPVPTAEPVVVEATVAIPSEDKIGPWIQEQNARGTTCTCGCGRRIEVKRVHY